MRSDFAVRAGFRQVRAKAVLAEVPAHALHRLSCGNSGKGPRLSDWTLLRTNCPETKNYSRWLLIRRRLYDPNEVTFLACGDPPATTLEELAHCRPSMDHRRPRWNRLHRTRSASISRRTQHRLAGPVLRTSSARERWIIRDPHEVSPMPRLVKPYYKASHNTPGTSTMTANKSDSPRTKTTPKSDSANCSRSGRSNRGSSSPERPNGVDSGGPRVSCSYGSPGAAKGAESSC